MTKTSGGMSPNTHIQLLFILRNADMQSTADQVFLRQYAGNGFIITSVFANTKTGGATVACAGGIYSTTAKGGNVWVAAANSWLGLSAAGKISITALAAVATTDLATTTPYLSLTTGSTTACTADIFIYGVVTD